MLITANLIKNEKADASLISLKVQKRLQSVAGREELDENRRNFNLNTTGQSTVVIRRRVGLRKQKLNRVQKVDGRMHNVRRLKAHEMIRNYREMNLMLEVRSENKISQNLIGNANKIKKSLKMIVKLMANQLKEILLKMKIIISLKRNRRKNLSKKKKK